MEMRSRFRLICYRRRGGTYYLHDKESGQRTSLETPDKARANELLVAHSEAAREPAFNLQKARVYLAASDPQILTRTWRIALEALTLSKPEGSENRHRWETFAKNKALKPILDVVLLETLAEQVLKVATAKTVSTNVFMRRLHNHCVGMKWLPWPVLAPKLWPKVKFKKKRAIKYDEHLRIIAREKNPDRRNFYELCWHLAGSQSDIANLQAEDVDWTDGTVCYERQKLAALDETDVKPPIIKFGKRCAAILRSLPQSGPLFPNLAKDEAKDRANEFRQRCHGLGITGVTLHSYRYSWAERARKAGYPHRQAEEALGHNCKAVHIAYAKRAQVKVDSLEDYEDLAAKKAMNPGTALPDVVPPNEM
jgi:integrase